jgi:hypothetical protein
MKSTAGRIIEMRYHAVPSLPRGPEIVLEAKIHALLNGSALEKAGRHNRKECPLSDP